MYALQKPRSKGAEKQDEPKRSAPRHTYIVIKLSNTKVKNQFTTYTGAYQCIISGLLSMDLAGI